jgi:hypothetical protein
MFAFTRALSRHWEPGRPHRVHPARPRLQRLAVAARRARRGRDRRAARGRPRRRHARCGAAEGPLRRRPHPLGRDLRRVQPHRPRTRPGAGGRDRARGGRAHPRRRRRTRASPAHRRRRRSTSTSCRPRRTSGTARTRVRSWCAATCCARSSPTGCVPPTTTGRRAGRPARRRSSCSPASRAAAEFMARDAGGRRGRTRTRRGCSPCCRRACTRRPGVTVHGPSVTPDRAPTVVFTVAGRDSGDVAQLPRRPPHRGVVGRQLRLRARRRHRPARPRRGRARRRRPLHDARRRRCAARGAGRARTRPDPSPSGAARPARQPPSRTLREGGCRRC